MDLFFGFGCNICYKTDDGSLKNISEENMKHLKDTLITFVGHIDIKYNEIYICQLCCEELIHFDKFRELCCRHLMQLQQKSKLDLEGVNSVNTFVHEENSVIKCDESQVAFTNEEDIKNVTMSRYEHTKLETFDVSNISVTSQIQFMKEEIDLNDEINSSDSEILTSFENKSREQANPDVKEPVVNDSSDSMKEELQVKHEKSHSEGVELERIEDEFGECVHVGFQIGNVCTILNVGNDGNEDIGNQEGKIGMKSRSRKRNNKPTATIINTHPSHVHMREGRNVRSPTALQSTASKWLQPGAKVNACIAGNQSLKTRNSLLRLERIHSGDKPYKCTVCNKTFGRASHLTRHKRLHSGDKPFKCTVCDKAFTRSWSLVIHKRIHSGDKPYKCTVCNKAFTHTATLTQHKRLHSGDKPYKCSVCNKAFTQSANLTEHKRLHTGDKPYKCTVCDKAFARSSSLAIHKRIHSGDKPYKCTVCNKAFAQSSHLTTHKRSHSGDKPYKCTVCDKAFAHSSHLTTHKRSHSGDTPYKCTMCNKAFTRPTNLTQHKRTHSGDKPYTCTVCKKAFTHSTNLTRHKRSHSGDKPYKCTECNKAFTRSTNLTQHKRTHSGDKPYKCTV